MHLHEFLARVHEILQPETYLEVGVQHGTSLKQAVYSSKAIGVDPNPLITEDQIRTQLPDGNVELWKIPSDAFFEDWRPMMGLSPIDLGFVDGLHHFEQALRDFLNIEKYTTGNSVIILDDVLPRNQDEAAREQCPGDWTGDVWKVSHILLKYRPDLIIHEVNTQPTGTLVVYGFHPENRIQMRPAEVRSIVPEYMELTEVPDNVINRAYAVEPEWVLDQLREFRS